METYQNQKTTRTVTRPANATPYAIGTSIQSATAARIFLNVSNQSDLGGYLTRVTLITNKSDHTEAIRLHLYEATPTLSNDTAAFVLSNTGYIGYVDFTTFVTGGTGSTMAISEGAFSKPMQFSVTNGSLNGLLEARAAFTPTSGQTFIVSVYSEVSS